MICSATSTIFLRARRVRMGRGQGFGRRFGGRCAIAVALWLVGASGVNAQTVTGTIQGTVTDSSGGVLPGAAVTITNADTGAERTVVTNDAGFYSASFIQIGRYS